MTRHPLSCYSPLGGPRCVAGVTPCGSCSRTSASSRSATPTDAPSSLTDTSSAVLLDRSAVAPLDVDRQSAASETALWRSSLALFLSAQLYALALGAIWFSLPAGFFDAGGVALTS